MKKTIPLLTLLILIGAAVLLSTSVNAREKPCRERDHVTRTRDGHETVTVPVVDPCQDSTVPQPPIPQTDLNVVLQDVAQPTHVQPDTDTVTVASVLLDASHSDKDIHTTSLGFDITITSFADYSSLENCELYHDGSLVEASGVSQAIATVGDNGVTTSHGLMVYSLPAGSVITPHHANSSLDLICDLPPALTEARITTEISDDNFTAIDSDGHSVDYNIISLPGHTIEVYTGDTPPGDAGIPNEDPVPGTDGEDGSDGTDADDDDSGGGSTDPDDRHPNREDHKNRADRR